MQQRPSFEGWFEDSTPSTGRKEQGMIACPVCEDTGVCKMPSMFAIKGSGPARAPQAGLDVEMEALGKQIVDYVKTISTTWVPILPKRRSRCTTG
jgi:hypothetical protein